MDSGTSTAISSGGTAATVDKMLRGTTKANLIPPPARPAGILAFKPHSDRKSYQLRALARKSVSYQRQQVCSTCCCVFMCPLLMVVICGVLGIVVTGLINNLTTAENVQYCSNANASDPNTLLPYGTATAPTDSTGRILLNVAPTGYCVDWFGRDYPTSYPYSPPYSTACIGAYNPEVCPFEPSTLLSTPPSGWLTPVVAITEELLTLLSSFQYNFWSLVAYNPALTDIGALPEPSAVNLLNFPPLVSNTTGTGFLGTLPVQYFVLASSNLSNPTTIQLGARPYFEETAYNAEAIDDELTLLITEAIDTISKLVDPDPLNKLPSTDPAVVAYQSARNAALAKMPYGALIMNHMGPEVYDYILQVGTNRRLAYQSTSSVTNGGAGAVASTPFPTEGIRRLLYQSRLSQAIMANSSGLPDATITQGFRKFPENASTSLSLPIASYIGQILYPFGVSFLLPIFVLALVKDKEERVLIMMKMNGLKMWAYYLTEYVLFYTLHVISTIVFILTGLAFQLAFFTVTAPGVYILLFFLWGNVQIGMAFVLSTFFARSRTALLVTYLLVVMGIIINVAVNNVFSSTAPLAYFIYPPFAFYRGVIIVNQAAFDSSLIPYTISLIVPGNEVFSVVMAMLIAIVVLFVLAAYLTYVMPSEFGIQRPWHFPVTDLVRYIKQRRSGVDPEAEENSGGLSDEAFYDNTEDDDVMSERRRVEARMYPVNSSLVMHNMRKAFSPTKVAVRGVSMAIEPDTIFGLLGPNGAGKTTLINILTGLYKSTAGDATIDGYRVGSQMRDVYMSIGVCPQHDVLWGDLTVEDHLLFYARLKGVPAEKEAAVVTAMLTNMSLQKFRTRQTKSLSGGEKRRVSIAIALIGDGKVVFLDEPTTGLDPEVRRLIWEIINRQRAGKTIILTTHSMEEAEVLCQSIGIMAKGQLRCFGTPLHLKNKYGNGFKLSVSANADDAASAQAYIESVLPAGFKRLDNFSGTFSYEFPHQENCLANLFEELGAHAKDHAILDWGISQTTLEEVFLTLVRNADAEPSE